MKVFLECIPCFLKQALEAVRLATPDEFMQEEAMRRVLQELSEISWNTSPPYIGRRVHHLVKHITGNSDPYAPLKRQSNEIALRLYPELVLRVKEASDPFETAVRLALAGNMIDFGARPGEKVDIEKEIEEVMDASLEKNVLTDFRNAIAQAKRVLFLGDNAGEIFFDKLLIQQIGPEKITYVVKAKPIINDATLEDAKIAGLSDLVLVIDNGSDYPGTVLAECSQTFLEFYNQADIVLAKGQGNYETLNDTDKPIVFLLKVKCPVVAKDVKKQVGDLVIYLHNVYI